MKIDIILPFREQFTLSKASAVSTSVKNSIIYSSYKNNISSVKNYIEGEYEDIEDKDGK